MSEEQKVKDLSQEEQDAILAEAKQYNIPGILPECTVEELKQKIEEQKSELAKKAEECTEDCSKCEENACAKHPSNNGAVDVDDKAGTKNEETEIVVADNVDAGSSEEEQKNEEVNPYAGLSFKELQEKAKEKGLKYTAISTENLLKSLIEYDKNPTPKQITPPAKAETKEIKKEGRCVVCHQPVYNGECSGCGRIF